MDSLGKFLHDRAEQYLARRSEQQENLVLEFLMANPDLGINDIELVESRIDNDNIIWYCRERGSNA